MLNRIAKKIPEGKAHNCVQPILPLAYEIISCDLSTLPSIQSSAIRDASWTTWEQGYDTWKRIGQMAYSRKFYFWDQYIYYPTHRRCAPKMINQLDIHPIEIICTWKYISPSRSNFSIRFWHSSRLSTMFRALNIDCNSTAVMAPFPSWSKCWNANCMPISRWKRVFICTIWWKYISPLHLLSGGTVLDWSIVFDVFDVAKKTQTREIYDHVSNSK